MADHARGQRLRQLRNERGLSQEDVAHAIDVTAKTYGDWERGGGIHPANARKIARYFKVKPGEIIDPEIPVAPDFTGPAAEQLDRIEEKLDEIVRRLPPAEDDETTTDLPDGPDSPPADEDAA